jgi:hypothetical protein
VIELPPLSPHEIYASMRGRGIALNDQRAGVLCILSGGNWREAIRLLGNANQPPAQDAADSPDWEITLATRTLAAETAALCREIIRTYGGDPGASKVLSDVWRALPDAAFDSPDAFEALGRSAIHHFWNLAPLDATWLATICEPWRRILIKLFVMAHVIAVVRTDQTAQWDH